MNYNFCSAFWREISVFYNFKARFWPKKIRFFSGPTYYDVQFWYDGGLYILNLDLNKLQYVSFWDARPKRDNIAMDGPP